MRAAVSSVILFSAIACDPTGKAFDEEPPFSESESISPPSGEDEPAEADSGLEGDSEDTAEPNSGELPSELSLHLRCRVV